MCVLFLLTEDILGQLGYVCPSNHVFPGRARACFIFASPGGNIFKISLHLHHPQRSRIPFHPGAIDISLKTVSEV